MVLIQFTLRANAIPENFSHGNRAGPASAATSGSLRFDSRAHLRVSSLIAPSGTQASATSTFRLTLPRRVPTSELTTADFSGPTGVTISSVTGISISSGMARYYNIVVNNPIAKSGTYSITMRAGAIPSTTTPNGSAYKYGPQSTYTSTAVTYDTRPSVSVSSFTAPTGRQEGATSVFRLTLSQTVSTSDLTTSDFTPATNTSISAITPITPSNNKASIYDVTVNNPTTGSGSYFVRLKANAIPTSTTYKQGPASVYTSTTVSYRRRIVATAVWSNVSYTNNKLQGTLTFSLANVTSIAAADFRVINTNSSILRIELNVNPASGISSNNIDITGFPSRTPPVSFTYTVAYISNTTNSSIWELTFNNTLTQSEKDALVITAQNIEDPPGTVLNPQPTVSRVEWAFDTPVTTANTGSGITIRATPPVNTHDSFKLRLKATSVRSDSSASDNAPANNVDSTSVSIDNRPNLSVTTFSGPTGIQTGATVNFTLTFSSAIATGELSSADFTVPTGFSISNITLTSGNRTFTITVTQPTGLNTNRGSGSYTISLRASSIPSANTHQAGPTGPVSSTSVQYNTWLIATATWGGVSYTNGRLQATLTFNKPNSRDPDFTISGIRTLSFEVLNSSDVVQTTGWNIDRSNSSTTTGTAITVFATPPANTNASFKLRLKANSVRSDGSSAFNAPASNTDSGASPTVDTRDQLTVSSFTAPTATQTGTTADLTLTFSHSVPSAQLTSADFTMPSIPSGISVASITPSSGNNATYTISINQITNFEGNYNISLNANTIPDSTINAYKQGPISSIDSTNVLSDTREAITVSSFTAPSGSQTAPTTTLTLTLNKSIPIDQIIAADFTIPDNITINSITAINPSNNKSREYNVNLINPTESNGTYTIDLNANAVTATTGINSYKAGPISAHTSGTVTYDTRAALTAEFLNVPSATVTAFTTTFTIRFSKEISAAELGVNDLSVNPTGVSGISIDSISPLTGTARNYTITISHPTNSTGSYTVTLAQNSIPSETNYLSGPPTALTTSSISIQTGPGIATAAWSNVSFCKGTERIYGTLTFSGYNVTGIESGDFEIINSSGNSVSSNIYIVLSTTPSSSPTISNLSISGLPGGITVTGINGSGTNYTITLSTKITTTQFSGVTITITGYTSNPTVSSSSIWAITISGTTTISVIVAPADNQTGSYKIRLIRNSVRSDSSTSDNAPAVDIDTPSIIVDTLSPLPAAATWSNVSFSSTSPRVIQGTLTISAIAITGLETSDFEVQKRSGPVDAYTWSVDSNWTISLPSGVTTVSNGGTVTVTATPLTILNGTFRIRLKGFSLRSTGSTVDNSPLTDRDTVDVAVNTTGLITTASWANLIGSNKIIGTISFDLGITQSLTDSDFDIISNTVATPPITWNKTLVQKGTKVNIKLSAVPGAAIPHGNFSFSTAGVPLITVTAADGGMAVDYILTLNKKITESNLTSATITISGVGAPTVLSTNRRLLISEVTVTGTPAINVSDRFKLRILKNKAQSSSGLKGPPQDVDSIWVGVNSAAHMPPSVRPGKALTNQTIIPGIKKSINLDSHFSGTPKPTYSVTSVTKTRTTENGVTNITVQSDVELALTIEENGSNLVIAYDTPDSAIIDGPINEFYSTVLTIKNWNHSGVESPISSNFTINFEQASPSYEYRASNTVALPNTLNYRKFAATNTHFYFEANGKIIQSDHNFQNIVDPFYPFPYSRTSTGSIGADPSGHYLYILLDYNGRRVWKLDIQADPKTIDFSVRVLVGTGRWDRVAFNSNNNQIYLFDKTFHDHRDAARETMAYKRYDLNGVELGSHTITKPAPTGTGQDQINYGFLQTAYDPASNHFYFTSWHPSKPLLAYKVGLDDQLTYNPNAVISNISNSRLHTFVYLNNKLRIRGDGASNVKILSYSRITPSAPVDTGLSKNIDVERDSTKVINLNSHFHGAPQPVYSITAGNVSWSSLSGTELTLTPTQSEVRTPPYGITITATNTTRTANTLALAFNINVVPIRAIAAWSNLSYTGGKLQGTLTFRGANVTSIATADFRVVRDDLNILRIQLNSNLSSGVAINNFILPAQPSGIAITAVNHISNTPNSGGSSIWELTFNRNLSEAEKDTLGSGITTQNLVPPPTVSRVEWTFDTPITAANDGVGITIAATPPANTDASFKLRLKARSVRSDNSASNNAPVDVIDSTSVSIDNRPQLNVQSFTAPVGTQTGATADLTLTFSHSIPLSELSNTDFTLTGNVTIAATGAINSTADPSDTFTITVTHPSNTSGNYTVSLNANSISESTTYKAGPLISFTSGTVTYNTRVSASATWSNVRYDPDDNKLKGRLTFTGGTTNIEGIEASDFEVLDSTDVVQGTGWTFDTPSTTTATGTGIDISATAPANTYNASFKLRLKANSVRSDGNTVNNAPSTAVPTAAILVDNRPELTAGWITPITPESGTTAIFTLTFNKTIPAIQLTAADITPSSSGINISSISPTTGSTTTFKISTTFPEASYGTYSLSLRARAIEAPTGGEHRSGPDNAVVSPLFTYDGRPIATGRWQAIRGARVLSGDLYFSGAVITDITLTDFQVLDENDAVQETGWNITIRNIEESTIPQSQLFEIKAVPNVSVIGNFKLRLPERSVDSGGIGPDNFPQEALISELAHVNNGLAPLSMPSITWGPMEDSSILFGTLTIEGAAVTNIQSTDFQVLTAGGTVQNSGWNLSISIPSRTLIGGNNIEVTAIPSNQVHADFKLRLKELSLRQNGVAYRNLPASVLDSPTVTIDNRLVPITLIWSDIPNGTHIVAHLTFNGADARGLSSSVFDILTENGESTSESNTVNIVLNTAPGTSPGIGDIGGLPGGITANSIAGSGVNYTITLSGKITGIQAGRITITGSTIQSATLDVDLWTITVSETSLNDGDTLTIRAVPPVDTTGYFKIRLLAQSIIIDRADSTNGPANASDSKQAFIDNRTTALSGTWNSITGGSALVGQINFGRLVFGIQPTDFIVLNNANEEQSNWRISLFPSFFSADGFTGNLQVTAYPPSNTDNPFKLRLKRLSLSSIDAQNLGITPRIVWVRLGRNFTGGLYGSNFNISNRPARLTALDIMNSPNAPQKISGIETDTGNVVEITLNSAVTTPSSLDLTGTVIAITLGTSVSALVVGNITITDYFGSARISSVNNGGVGTSTTNWNLVFDSALTLDEVRSMTIAVTSNTVTEQSLTFRYLIFSSLPSGITPTAIRGTSLTYEITFSGALTEAQVNTMVIGATSLVQPSGIAVTKRFIPDNSSSIWKLTLSADVSDSEKSDLIITATGINPLDPQPTVTKLESPAQDSPAQDSLDSEITSSSANVNNLHTIATDIWSNVVGGVELTGTVNFGRTSVSGVEGSDFQVLTEGGAVQPIGPTDWTIEVDQERVKSNESIKVTATPPSGIHGAFKLRLRPNSIRSGYSTADNAPPVGLNSITVYVDGRSGFLASNTPENTGWGAITYNSGSLGSTLTFTGASVTDIQSSDFQVLKHPTNEIQDLTDWTLTASGTPVTVTASVPPNTIGTFKFRLKKESVRSGGSNVDNFPSEPLDSQSLHVDNIIYLPASATWSMPTYTKGKLEGKITFANADVTGINVESFKVLNNSNVEQTDWIFDPPPTSASDGSEITVRAIPSVDAVKSMGRFKLRLEANSLYSGGSPNKNIPISNEDSHDSPALTPPSAPNPTVNWTYQSGGTVLFTRVHFLGTNLSNVIEITPNSFSVLDHTTNEVQRNWIISVNRSSIANNEFVEVTAVPPFNTNGDFKFRLNRNSVKVVPLKLLSPSPIFDKITRYEFPTSINGLIDTSPNAGKRVNNLDIPVEINWRSIQYSSNNNTLTATVSFNHTISPIPTETTLWIRLNEDLSTGINSTHFTITSSSITQVAHISNTSKDGGSSIWALTLGSTLTDIEKDGLTITSANNIPGITDGTIIEIITIFKIIDINNNIQDTDTDDDTKWTTITQPTSIIANEVLTITSKPPANTLGQFAFQVPFGVLGHNHPTTATPSTFISIDNRSMATAVWETIQDGASPSAVITFYGSEMEGLDITDFELLDSDNQSVLIVTPKTIIIQLNKKLSSGINPSNITIPNLPTRTLPIPPITYTVTYISSTDINSGSSLWKLTFSDELSDTEKGALGTITLQNVNNSSGKRLNPQPIACILNDLIKLSTTDLLDSNK